MITHYINKINIKLTTYYSNNKIRIREFLNPLFAPFRKRQLKLTNFTIISNNCWGGHVYRYFGIEYLSPTIGLYIYSSDYIKMLKNLKWYMQQPLSFISIEESRYKDDLVAHNHLACPIGKLADIEIIFLHYKTREEALNKWERRKARINWDNLYIKNSEQNLCSFEDLVEFNNLPYKNKFVFTKKDYKLDSQIIFKGYYEDTSVKNDTTNFRKYINPVAFINEMPYKKRQ